MTNANIGFLIPITIINLGALFALCRAMIIAKDGGYVYHPDQTRPVIYDDIDEGEQVPDEWMHKVSERPTTVRSSHLRCRFYESLTKILVTKRIFQSKYEEQSRRKCRGYLI
jgi:NADH:ubiquinone oxidoreductase subunit